MASPGDPTESVRPPATVVVCTRDRPDFLPDCLASLAAAMGPGDDLVVVESGDSQAAACLAGLAVQPSWHHIPSRDRRKSAKLNVAISRSQRDIVVITDDDCRVDRAWVAAMAQTLAEHRRAGIAFGPVNGLDHVPGGTAPPDIRPGPAPIENWNYAHGAAMAVRKSAVVEAGGFDERLGPGSATHGEEADLVVRLGALGWQCMIAPAPPVTHLDWRDDGQRLANLLVYERGAGAWLGAGLRRDPRQVAKLLLLRLRYQAGLWTDRGIRGWWFGPRTTAAFLAGVARGLRYPPRRWL